MTPILRNITQAQAVKVFVRWGGVERRESKRGHRIVKMPNGAIVSIPTGTVKVGLLLSQIRKADRTPEEFLDAL